MGGGESALLFILNVKTFVIKLHTNAPMHAGCIVETSQMREILALDIYLALKLLVVQTKQHYLPVQ